MKLRRSVTIPCLLLIYLGVMSWMGIDGLRSGQTTPAQYIATIAITLGVIILLYFFLRRRERLRDKRNNK